MQITTCTMGDEGSWHASLLVYSPIALLVLVVIWPTKRHHSTWLWLAAPLVIVIPFCVLFTLPFLFQSAIQGQNMCAILDDAPGFNEYGSDPVLRLWAPTQLLLLGSYTWLVLTCWHARNRASGAP